jgi:hypothetical protein
MAQEFQDFQAGYPRIQLGGCGRNEASRALRYRYRVPRGRRLVLTLGHRASPRVVNEIDETGIDFPRKFAHIPERVLGN